MEQPSSLSPYSAERDEAYLRLLAEHERGIAAYIFSLVSSPADAADILQECKLTMWRMFDRFELGATWVSFAHALLEAKNVSRLSSSALEVRPAMIDAP